MSERGVFAVDRGVFDHDCFADEPFTEREAWMWLVSEAAWKARQRRVGAFRVSLKRGQVSHSLRFMAEQWQWSEPRVRRFLAKLKTDAMVSVSADAGVTVITICNYDKYQRVSLPNDAHSDAHSDAGPTQDRRKLENNKTIEGSEREGGRASSGSQLSEDSFEIATAILASVKKPPDDPAGLTLRYQAQAWLNEGIPKDFIIPRAVAVAHKHINYVSATVRSAWIEYQAQPPPAVGSPTASRSQGHGNAKPSQPSAIIAAIDEHIRGFRDEAREDGPGGGTGEGAPRLLSHG